MRNRDAQERSKILFELDMPTPDQMERARDDFWWGHEQDAQAFEAAKNSGMGGIF
jgi:hypothetical protein